METTLLIVVFKIHAVMYGCMNWKPKTENESCQEQRNERRLEKFEVVPNLDLETCKQLAEIAKGWEKKDRTIYVEATCK